ncbi:MAG: VWA domain-containing protein [Planctomycetes bacterium]|nr:VWA domain-containing protein [Planctomycetota bacterium]
MNETTTTKKTEFVFRRLADSFDQFVGDLTGTLFGGTVSLSLLGLLLIAVVARVTYHYATAARRAAGTKDPTAGWLKTGTWVALLAFVGWGLYAYYVRDTDPARATAGEAVSTVAKHNAIKWYAFTAALFLLGCVFVLLMYVRDMKTVRWYFALPLAGLRMATYAILCFVFLLPAEQTWEDTNKQSRVVVLLDISPSVTAVTDEIGTGPGRKPKTRMDVVIEFLSDERVAFLKNLLDKNPVAVYAFGTRLDESAQVIAQGEPVWSRAEWEAFARYDFKPFVLRGLSDEGKIQVRKLDVWEGDRPGTPDWAAGLYARRDDPELQKTFGLTSADDAEKLKKNLVLLDRRIDVARTIALGTNVADSVTAAVNRESANMVQGIVVFSDGRSNLGSDSGYAELRERAAREKIPVFTVAVGEDRQTSAIVISDVQAPGEAPVDEAWKVVVEADGVNMANKEVEVFLDLFMPETQADGSTRPKDMKKGAPDHTLTERLVFAPGDPPHGQAEFVIDPAKLPEKLTVESKDAAIKKRVLVAGKWGARARIAKDPQEAFAEAEHVRERPGINVVQQKLRVLLIAGAPSREFSFLRTLLVREAQDKRATLTTFIQNEAGTTGKLTPETDEKILLRFPNRFDLSNKPPADPADAGYNFNDYDVILAFDPDWSELNAQQADDLGRWVREGGGGLIYVAGPIHTFQLARIEENSGPLLPLLNVLPVIPADIVAQRIKPIPKTPRRLYLHPERIIGSDLLKLDDKVADDPVAGWERFFTDRDKYVKLTDTETDGTPKELLPRRGFFSAYPIKAVKPGGAVLAEFADAGDNREPVVVPWIVTNNPSAAYRTAFLASGELYRMRVFEPGSGTGREYFERFYVKLIKYMAAKRNVKAPRGRVLVSKEGVSGAPLRVQARILNESAKPYEPGQIEPKFKVVQETPGGEKHELGPWPLAPKQTAAGGFDGYYAGQVLLDPKQFPPGDFVYRVVIDVPDSAGETLTDTFGVRRSDPEMDNTKPDFPAMLRMASEFDNDFQARVTDTKVKLELGQKLPKEAGVPRLAFKITDTELLRLVPECMGVQKVQHQNRGPVRDVWDRGVTMPTVEPASGFVQKYLVSWWSGQRLSVVMLSVVFLLSLEWLARKLLRLA